MTNNKVVLSAKDIRKSFKAPDGSSLEVIKGSSLELFEGESVSLRGESGAGKTTFMNIIACLESLTSGEVYWLDKRV
ncbi:MAG: ATP-binding cassette domain-containing protein, partial [Opitutales bacterium]|nr:ATP-binding cassette domain-containing protein [Opitutales bacterium]